MATADIFVSQPGNAADGAWIRFGSTYWYGLLSTVGDNAYAKCQNYDVGGDDGRNFYSFGLSGIPVYCVINSMTLYTYLARTGTGAGTVKSGWHLGGTVSWGANNPGIVGGQYYGDAMARPGGGSWTRADLSNLNLRLYANQDATRNDREMRVDQLFVRVDWSYIAIVNPVCSPATSVTQTSATLPAQYDANGDGDTEWRIMYKPNGGSYDDPGWTASSNTGGNNVSRNLSGLTAGTLYYFKLQARNSGDVVYESVEASFTTTAASSTAGIILFF